MYIIILAILLHGSTEFYTDKRPVTFDACRATAAKLVDPSITAYCVPVAKTQAI